MCLNYYYIMNVNRILHWAWLECVCDPVHHFIEWSSRSRLNVIWNLIVFTGDQIQVKMGVSVCECTKEAMLLFKYSFNQLQLQPGPPTIWHASYSMFPITKPALRSVASKTITVRISWFHVYSKWTVLLAHGTQLKTLIYHILKTFSRVIKSTISNH